MGKVDAGDVFQLIGIALIGAGLWLYIPWVALLVVGAILLIIGMRM